jgi:putative MATE family efflux protein
LEQHDKLKFAISCEVFYMLRRYIGDRAFYRRVLGVVLPIMIQNAITNFVWMLDNVMVGQVGNLPMSGVSIVNQLLFVFNLCVFGATSGAGIFTAQFFGNDDREGIRYTFRFKVIVCLMVCLTGAAVFLFGAEDLIGFYLQGEGAPEDAAAILEYGREYLYVMLLGLVPFALSNAYAGTLRETGQTVVPMLSGVAAVLVNLVLNYILIFGKFGAPALGVVGAAWATVISRFTELIIVAVWTHTHGDKHPFIRGAYRSLAIPGGLLRQIIAKGTPLMLNEFLWAAGMATLNQCYSTCGLDVVPAANINSAIYNLAGVGFMAMGNAVGILMGQMLGAGAAEAELRDTNRKLIFTSCMTGLVFGSLMAAISGVFPELYNTTEAVRSLATVMICISAVMMPFNAYTNACYFTLRSGGQTFVTFLFDSCFVWAVCVPVAWCLTRLTALPILPVYMIVNGMDLIKSAVGAWLLKKGLWIRKLAQKDEK